MYMYKCTSIHLGSFGVTLRLVQYSIVIPPSYLEFFGSIHKEYTPESDRSHGVWKREGKSTKLGIVAPRFVWVRTSAENP
jgi:hypothetical protein